MIYLNLWGWGQGRPFCVDRWVHHIKYTHILPIQYRRWLLGFSFGGKRFLDISFNGQKVVILTKEKCKQQHDIYNVDLTLSNFRSILVTSSFSNSSDSLPRMYWPERMARKAASSTSALTKHFDNGILLMINLFIRNLPGLAQVSLWRAARFTKLTG